MINKLQEALDSAKRIVFFSGAGMSTASGIPDFRSATGLYKNVYRAEEMLSHTFYEYKTEDFFEFYREKMLYPDAKPNYAHKFIARLQDKKDVSVVTQNIDGLHQAAGSKKVYELHGSVLRNYCSRCHKFFDLNYIMHYLLMTKGWNTVRCVIHQPVLYGCHTVSQHVWVHRFLTGIL